MSTCIKALPAKERQMRLLVASKQYMRGQITNAEYRTAEKSYMTNYSAAVRALARTTTHQSQSKERICKGAF